MTNFDFLKTEQKFNSFADAAVAAEKILPIDHAASVVNCRRAMEFAVKWMYSVDGDLVMPYQDNLACLMTTEEFRAIVPLDVIKRMDLIRRIGNQAAHAGRVIGHDEAALCLENLFIFLDYVACCYAENYAERKFDTALLEVKPDAPAPVQSSTESDIDLAALIEENKALKTELTARRAEQQHTYVPKPLDISEYKTRKIYIDTMLRDAGWVEGKNWINEVELYGMPNNSGVGYADYVLYGDDGRALAVIEAKRTCVDVSKGRQQAKLYADILEKKYHRRPVVFLTNGFETHIVDNCYPERRVAAIFSKRDLEKLFNLRAMRSSLKYVTVDKSIAGRYYQESAIKAVCDSFDNKNRRKALLVMATGSGKTRTVIALCKVLLERGWIKNILFLADRNSLVTQAKRSFVNLLPDLSVTNLCEEKDNYTAHCVFSTYQTMMNCIDDVHDAEGKLFTSGHFDLVICDEAHRSIYNKYRDIFNYFDATLVGLTATPKDEIDKNTYTVFELESGVPTYKWPDSVLASLIPQPASEYGKVSFDNENSFWIDVYNISQDQFEEYIEECKSSGFTIDYSRLDSFYTAIDENGYSLRLNYDSEEETMSISMNAPNDEPKETTSTNEENSESTEESAETESTVASEESTEEEKENSSDLVDGMRAEFKAAMDSYEEFFDEYCEFMKKYSESDNVVSMLADYTEYMTKYADAMEKLDEIGEEELNDAELKYYMEVMGRINQKLLEVATD